jgi:hypothetical protein
MFIVCQFPIADARPFLAGETHRLILPDWPGAVAGKDFIRFIGGVQPRLRKTEVWPGEDRFCDAKRAIRFQVPLGSRRLGPATNNSTLACQFRRLFSNGRGVTRLEIGFSRRSAIKGRLDGDGCQQMVVGCLATPVTVQSLDGSPISSDLLRVDRALSKYLLYCTTKTKRDPEIELQSWWLTPTRPLVMVEYRSQEVSSLPKNAHRIKTLGWPIDLHHDALWHHGRLTTIWYLGIGWATDPEVVRRLRIHLFRLHAERECLSTVLHNINLDRITVKRGTEQSERLQWYLDNAFNVFFSPKRYGIDQSEILEVAYGFDDLVSSGERPALQQRLAEIRGNISQKVTRALESQSQLQSSRSMTIIGGTTVFAEGDSYVDSKSIKFGKVTGSITGNIGIDSPITNSFNRIQKSDANDELKDKLAQLTAAVAELVKQLPEDQAKAAARDLQTFTEEATAEAPRRSILEVMGSSLSKAAEVVGQVGVPVLSLVTAILALF